MIFQDKLNLNNLYTAYGLVIQTGTEKLLEFPERKESLSNDWREENGGDYDLTLVRFKDREIILQCAFVAETDVIFWQNYNAFFAEISKEGWQNLYIADHGQTYEVFYKKTSDFKKTLKRLKNVDKVFVKFNLTLQVK